MPIYHIRTMLKLITLLILVTCTSAYYIPGTELVVNGSDAFEGEIPYIVGLKHSFSSAFIFCGGSIITPTAILTAAHCVVERTPSMVCIQYGILKATNDKTNVIVSKAILIHERYQPRRDTSELIIPNDIAILVLRTAIQYSATVQPIKLPEQDETPPFGESAVLSGWGKIATGGPSPEHLQRADLFVYSDEECRKAHEMHFSPACHLCASVPDNGKEQCNGDSGGPLEAKGKQWGVVSWSIKPCGTKGFPGVYARVPSYVNWIKEKLNISHH